MKTLEKKVKRLDPVLEERKALFDTENQRLIAVRQKKIETVSAMKKKQKDYMQGLERLNNERGSSERSMLDALEIGLDAVKQDWMTLYNQVLEIEKEESYQLEAMAKAHRDLEAIKHLQAKYTQEIQKEGARRDQKLNDEIALRKFSNSY